MIGGRAAAECECCESGKKAGRAWLGLAASHCLGNARHAAFAEPLGKALGDAQRKARTW